MRTEKEMYDLIIGYAKNDERIRAVYLNGSRANPFVKEDSFRDYDIVYVVIETESFIEDKNFVNIFGDIAIWQEPDLVDKSFGKTVDFGKSYTWLMLFKDGNRIDLHIETLEEAKVNLLKDSLTVVLLDKDGSLPPIGEPSEEDYYVKRPTKLEFESACNEFWWCLQNVSKGILRDQLPYSMDMFNTVIRKMLNKMTDWKIAIEYDFKINTGMMGKYYKEFLPLPLYERYVGTYCRGEYDDLWSSLFGATSLFSDFAKEVSSHLGFIYNLEEERNSISHLMDMMALYNEKSYY